MISYRTSFAVALMGLALSSTACGMLGTVDGLIDDEALFEPLPPSGAEAPSAGHDSYSVQSNTMLLVRAKAGVLNNDHYVEAAAARSGLTEAGGYFDFRGDGSFTYWPPVDFAGADHFDYDISNPNGTTTGTVLLKVSEPGDVPVP